MTLTPYVLPLQIPQIRERTCGLKRRRTCIKRPPPAAGAQQGDRVRRIGVLMGGGENDPELKARLSAFTQALPGLGWTDGRNMRMDVRWYGEDINRMRALAQELAGLQPDIILAPGPAVTAALQPETRTIPIVFASTVDPVAIGIVPRLNQPGGNITGFALLEASLGGKWLELLSEIAPGLKRAAIMFNPDIANASIYTPSFETAARSLNQKHDFDELNSRQNWSR
jgi:putative ABC transport system substrate-binding protein